MALESILQPHELQVRPAVEGQLRRLTLVLAPSLPASMTVKVKIRDTVPLKRPVRDEPQAKVAQQAEEPPSAVAAPEQLAPSSSSSSQAATSAPATPPNRGRRRNHRRRGGAQAAPAETAAPPATPPPREPSHTQAAAPPVVTQPTPPPVEVSSEPVIETLTLSHLPPITLVLQLPPLYPLHQPPRLDSLRASWLTRAQALWLDAQLRRQWEDSRAEVLYTWSEWLLTGLWDQDQCGAFLSSSDSSAESHLFLSGDALLPSLLSRHEQLATRTAFEGERFGCSICLSERPGQQCARLVRCGHVFCQDCLAAYLGAMIREGLHRQAVCCPDPECTKARIERERKGDPKESEEDGISEEELREFVGAEACERLKWLRRKAEDEADPTAQHCPRKGCSGLARLDKAEVGTPYESMRLCPK